VLPSTLLIWFILGEKWNLMSATQAGVLVSIATTPFGWSYDFVLLLLPTNQLLVWLATSSLHFGERLVTIAMLLGVYLAYYLQRIASPSELYFYWVPLAITVIYGWTAWRCARSAGAGTVRRQR